MSTGGTQRVPEPTEVRVESASRRLVISWEDGLATQYPWDDLHNACPSATCRGHFPGEKDPPNVQGITLLDVMEVGSYAIRFRWSEGGCQDGIYTWEYLREIGKPFTGG
jgi:DUF971 family protein